jgi:hypothetical protein
MRNKVSSDRQTGSRGIQNGWILSGQTSYTQMVPRIFWTGPPWRKRCGQAGPTWRTKRPTLKSNSVLQMYSTYRVFCFSRFSSVEAIKKQQILSDELPIMSLKTDYCIQANGNKFKKRNKCLSQSNVVTFLPKLYRSHSSSSQYVVVWSITGPWWTDPLMWWPIN